MALRHGGLAALLLTVSSGAQAAPQRFVAEYGLSFLGLTVGKTVLTAERTGERYVIGLDGGLSGMAGWFFEGGGKASSRGRLASAGTVPSEFRIDAHYSSQPVKVAVGFDDGKVRTASVDPAPMPRPDRIPVSDADKAGVTDPVGMLAIPAPSGNLDPSLCNRRIPVFDGSTRADLVLSGGKIATVTSGPFRGQALDCRVRWVPISGHRAKSSSVKRMRENEDIKVRFAPAPDVLLLLPLSIAVGTTWGTAKIDATGWGDKAEPTRPTDTAAAAARH